MSPDRRRHREIVIRFSKTAPIVAIVAASLAGCVGGNFRMQDAAGVTAEQVSGQSLHREFDHFRDRYEHMQVLLADAQRAVDDGEWRWNGGDDIPISGGDGGATASDLHGADDDNSYYLTSTRLRFPEGAHGSEDDLAPMQAYFESQHCATAVKKVGPRYYLVGVTDDGWQFEYMVQPSGQYALTVSSELYWVQDYDALLHGIVGRAPTGGRTPTGGPLWTRPGEYPPFPKWDDPIIDGP